MVLIKPLLLALGICVTLSQGAPAKSKKQKIQVASFDSVEKSSEELENLPEILPMVMYDESGPQDHPGLKHDSMEEPPVPVLSEAKPSRSRKAPKKSKKSKKQKEEPSEEDEPEYESISRPYVEDEPGPRPYGEDEDEDDEPKSNDEEQEDEEDDDEEDDDAEDEPEGEAEAEQPEAEVEDDEAAAEDEPVRAPSRKNKKGKPSKSNKKKINYKQPGQSGRPSSSSSSSAPTKTNQKERGAFVVHDDDPHKKHYPTVPDYRPYDHQSFQRPAGGGFEGIGSYFSGLLSSFTGGSGGYGGYGGGPDHGYGGHGYGGHGGSYQGNHGGPPGHGPQSGFLGYGHGNFQQGTKNAGPVPGGKPTYHHGFYTSHY